MLPPLGADKNEDELSCFYLLFPLIGMSSWPSPAWNLPLPPFLFPPLTVSSGIVYLLQLTPSCIVSIACMASDSL